LLHFIASFATQLIIIHPPNNPELEDIPVSDLIIYLAQRLGSFNLPMFIAFYPNETYDMMPAEYTLLFRNARNVFRTHAPMTAFVWTAPSYSSTTQNPYYPGHASVDWVALSLLSNWKPESSYKNILHDFEIFYNSFHRHKPVMILPLGVSHFTRGDYTYRLKETAEEISRVYNELQNFPRLGLIVYGDAFTISQTYTDDFSVSIEKILTNAYRQAVSDNNFLQTLERTSQSTSKLIRSHEHGYVFENKIFIPIRTLENELFITAPRQKTQINDDYFTDSKKISEKKITTCTKRRVILIENKP
jgi:hypothetical protein